MHTNPTIIPLPSGEITKIASSFASGRVLRAFKNNHSILYTYRIAGEAAPTLTTDMVPFGKDPLYLSLSYSIDIYMVSENVDSYVWIELHDEADYYTNIARGYYPGKYGFASFGERTTEANNESGVIWANGAYAVPPTTGIDIEIVSSSTEDSASGTGIRTLGIDYLDINLDEKTVIKTLDGTNPVYLDEKTRFIQCLRLSTSGTNEAADGTIIAREKGGSQEYNIILPDETRSSSSMRMVPKNKRLLLLSAVAGASSGANLSQNRIRLTSNTIEGIKYEDPFIFFPFMTLPFQDFSFGMNFPIPFPFYEGSIIGLDYKASKSGTIISGSWVGFVEPA